MTLRTAPPTLRLSRDVLAYLRGLAQGLPHLTVAKAYLVEDGRAGAGAHQAAVQSAILIARRAGLGSRWRLLRFPL
jgi:hypothetical protein